MKVKMTLAAISTGAIVAGAVAWHVHPLRAQQPAATVRPVLGQPIYQLNDKTYLRWPLPAELAKYGQIDGFALKPTVDHLVEVSERSRKDGNQWWGRITGTPYHAQTQEWIAQRFRAAGLETRFQAFQLPGVWYPRSWSMSLRDGNRSVTLKTAQPVLRSSGTTAEGIEAEPVYLGLGSKAEMAGRSIKGKIALIYSIPEPSALRHSASTQGAIKRAQDAGAAAVVVILGIPGNVTTQLWGSGGEGQRLEPVPTFSLGSEDGTLIREALETDQRVSVKLQLDVTTRTDLKPSAVWGVLPGQTDENILITAHSDAFFQGAVDNASGVAVMLGLVDYFSKIPREQRRRTITFLVPIGHHLSPDISLQWARDNMKPFWSKTALIINCEHVTTTQVYRFDRMLVRSNAATAHRFWVGMSDRLPTILFDDFSRFGMGLYAAPQIRPSGDLSPLRMLAPGIEVIESNQFYHSDMDVDTVPAAGLEGIARAYAKIVDDVNELTLGEIRQNSRPETDGHQ